MVNDGGVESYLKITRHLPVDHYGQVERALCPYLSGLGVHVGQLLLGFRPCWSPSGSVSVCSPTVSGSHAHVIWPFVWLASLASPPFPHSSGKTDLRWVGSLGCWTWRLTPTVRWDEGELPKLHVMGDHLGVDEPRLSCIAFDISC